MNRRVFLKGIGGASLAAPFLPSVYEKTAKAAATTPAQAHGHLLHPQRVPDRPVVPEGHRTDGTAR